MKITLSAPRLVGCNKGIQWFYILQSERLLIMSRTKNSAIISLVICALSSILLVVWLFTFPWFFNWFYTVYHGLGSEYTQTNTVIKIVIPTFYACAPFAACALYMLIRLLLNIINEVIFTVSNVKYLKWISHACYAVMLITVITGIFYIPLLVIGFATGIVGTLLRVVKDLMDSAVRIKEENDMTI